MDASQLMLGNRNCGFLLGIAALVVFVFFLRIIFFTHSTLLSAVLQRLRRGGGRENEKGRESRNVGAELIEG